MLEVSEPNFAFAVLMDSLIAHRRKEEYNKFIGLFLKSLLKLLKGFKGYQNKLDLESMIYKMH
jgi:hypothetical protein